MNTTRTVSCLLMLLLSVFSAELRAQALGEESRANPGQHQFPHPLNATMGIPDPVGSYNVRLNMFRQHNKGVSENDISGHLGYGLSKWGGIHLRSLGVRTTPLTEIIGMMGLWRDKTGAQGVSFLGIVGIPTGMKENNGEGHHGLSYLAGLAGRVTAGHLLTNDVLLHYDFSAKHYIAESGSVVRFSPKIFGVLDTRATIGDAPPEILLLPAVKIRVSSFGFIGVGYNVPVTTVSPFHRQVFLQFEAGGH